MGQKMTRYARRMSWGSIARIGPLATGACLLALLARPVAAQSERSTTDGLAASRPQFKSGIEVVALNVVVMDERNQYISGLGQRDFAVYEDGVQQDISHFADAASPLDLAILLDTSASVTDRIALIREAATGFLNTLRPGDRGAVVSFNKGVEILEPFTGDPRALTAAVNRINAKGGTSLYNAIYVTLKELMREAQTAKEVRRQAIVVLSDGADTTSALTFEDVLNQAKRANTSIYTIMMRSALAPPPTRHRYYSTAEFEMKTLAVETGARPVAAQKTGDLMGLYGLIADELAHQYSIGYVSRNLVDTGRFRRVVVRVPTHPAARPRSRTGYFAATEARVSLGLSHDLP